jgi:hypothetical protein
MSGCGGDCGAYEAKDAKDHERLAQADAVNDEAADQNRKNIREAINGLEKANIKIGETELLFEDVGDRAEGVVGVIAAKHRQADKDQDKPAVEPAGLRTSGVVHRRSFPSRLNSRELTTEKSSRNS